MNLKKSLYLSCMLSSMTWASQTVDLTVSIDHIASDKGMVYAQLFLGEDNYKRNESTQNAMMPAKKGAGQISFKDLTPGDYVVRLYHDENDNRELDMNAFGMPIEGYGFSNEAVGNMGPPKYKDMVVRIKTADDTVITQVKMIYL